MKTTDEMKFGEQQRQTDKARELGMGFSSGREGFDVYAAAASDYWREVAMRRGKQFSEQWLEIHALGARLQLMQGLAILGWAAFILSMMGV